MQEHIYLNSISKEDIEHLKDIAAEIVVSRLIQAGEKINITLTNAQFETLNKLVFVPLASLGVNIDSKESSNDFLYRAFSAGRSHGLSFIDDSMLADLAGSK